jgi:hypothetical protein
MFIKKACTCIPYEIRGFPRLQKPKKVHIFYQEVTESKNLPNFQRFLKTIKKTAQNYIILLRILDLSWTN